jgi:hypothetical protein
VNRDAVFLEIIVTVLEPNRFQKIAPIQISAENLHIHWETGKEFCMEESVSQETCRPLVRGIYEFQITSN